MTRLWKLFSGFVILSCVFGLAWFFVPPLLAQAQSPALPGAGGERWSVGTYVEGSPTYLAATGRFLESSGVFRTNRGVTELAYIFPAAATVKTVDGASFYILNRTGAYSGNVWLSLRVYDYAGTLKRSVSLANVDLEAAATGQWVALPLSATAGNLVINPGEFLAFHAALSGVAGDNLDARLLFDVVVH
ncbi:hypothetical protein LARV_00434 [Longilinea arvoryzae]|uniref:Uncharacterized protein n=1 Tax=Longilinea arvoryzae TaxID=360412 RepID=A0A0S7BGX2_9CHLR|nr:hypothetical protein [Longilinea arvoryzae]GAP12698.1 hypothetical protein LARV_00434 [Longilinea arvoryzae]